MAEKRELDPVVQVQPTLADRVGTLAERVQLAEHIASRLRNVVIGLAVLLLVVAAGGIWLWTVAQKAKDAADAVAEAAVVNCQNANEQRANTRTLWEFVLAASARPDPHEPPRTEEEIQFAADFKEWVFELYAERDCSDLNEKVEIPPPPSLK